MSEQKPELSLFEKYQIELQDDLKIDDFNVKEKQSLLPSLKHKWVTRLIQQKYELDKLLLLKKQGMTVVCNQLSEQNDIHLSQKSIMLRAEQHETIQKIDDAIRNSENIILYLEKVEKIWAQVTYDIKNMIELRKMETT